MGDPYESEGQCDECAHHLERHLSDGCSDCACAVALLDVTTLLLSSQPDVQQVALAAQPWFGDDTEAWLDHPNPVLAGRTPREVTLADGPEQALRLIERIASGVYL